MIHALAQTYGALPSDVERHPWSELLDWCAWSGLNPYEAAE